MGEHGNIAVDCTEKRPIGLFKEYLDDPKRTAATMLGNYYVTGDKGYKDEDGYIWFDSRSDDVIISSGYFLNIRSILFKNYVAKYNSRKALLDKREKRFFSL